MHVIVLLAAAFHFNLRSPLGHPTPTNSEFALASKLSAPLHASSVNVDFYVAKPWYDWIVVEGRMTSANGEQWLAHAYGRTFSEACEGCVQKLVDTCRRPNG